MIYMQLHVFDEDDDAAPEWELDDKESAELLSILNSLDFRPSSYDDFDEFDHAANIGYRGYSIRETYDSLSWTVMGEIAFLLNSAGVFKAHDPETKAEQHLFSLIDDPILKALSIPTRSTTPSED